MKSCPVVGKSLGYVSKSKLNRLLKTKYVFLELVEKSRKHMCSRLIFFFTFLEFYSVRYLFVDFSYVSRIIFEIITTD